MICDYFSPTDQSLMSGNFQSGCLIVHFDVLDWFISGRVVFLGLTRQRKSVFINQDKKRCSKLSFIEELTTFDIFSLAAQIL